MADFVQGSGALLVDELVGLDDRSVVDRVLDGFATDTSYDAGRQTDNLFVTLIDRADNDAVDRAAIFGGDDDILGSIHQFAGQIARVGGLERRVGQSLACTVSRDEVLEHGKTFTEVGKNRALDDLAGWFGHQTAHTCKLLDLGPVTSGTGIDHHEDRVRLKLTIIVFQSAEQSVGNLFTRVGPDILHLVLAFAIGDDTAAVLLLNFGNLLLGTLDESGLLLRNDHVVDSDGSSGTCCFTEAKLLELVESLHGTGLTDGLVAAPDDVTELFLTGNLVIKTEFLGPDLIKEDASHRGLDDR